MVKIEIDKLEKLLLDSQRVKTFVLKKNENLVRQEDLTFGIYYLLKGRVRVVLLSPKGTEKILCFHEKGDFIGEASFFSKSSSIASIYADEDSELLMLDGESFNTIIAQYPGISRNIIESMAYKLSLMVEQIEQITFYEATERIARFLLMLTDKFGQEEDGDIFIKRDLSDAQLGNFVGISREVTNRILGKFREKGILYKKNSMIVISDKEKLIAQANFKS